MGDVPDDHHAKTGHGIAYWRPEKCVGEMRLPGCPIDMGVPELDVAAAVAAGVGTAIIGVASTGGILLDAWIPSLAALARAGIDIAGGTHTKLQDNAELVIAAKEGGAELIDVRVPPPGIEVGSGVKRSGKRVLMIGTDCAVGMKNNDDEHWDVIEGQGSLLHPGYAAVSLGLLHGSQPDAIIVCHHTRLDLLDDLEVDIEIPPLNEVAETVLTLAQITNPNCIWAGISMNTSSLAAAERRGSVHLENWMALIPFRISRNTWDDFPSVVCEIELDGVIGRGEGLGVYYLDEDQKSMLAQIESIASELAAGAGRQELLELLPPGGARCAVDAALWDLEAQLSGTSAWESAGVTTDPIETVFTIGLEAEPEDMGERASAAADLTLFKVKLSDDRPVERIASIRKARPDARLVVDVNEGWEFEQLLEVAPALAELGVSMIEQPLRRGHDDQLEDYASPLPLCADESIQHAGELEQIASRYQMINIKLDKCGGLTHGLELATAAREKDLGVMIGCMGGTSLSMAPMHVIAHVADFVDIDGPLLLKNDRAGGFIYDKGIVSLPEKRFWGNS